MATELSSNCECPSCLQGTQSESDWNSSSRERGHGAAYSISSKTSVLSPIMQRFLSQCCSNSLESSDKEDSVLPPSEEESSVGFSQKQNLSQTSKNPKRKSKPFREMTMQELLRTFGDSGKFQPHSVSLGHFRDHEVVKLRRALYYSGIWVKHVHGSGLERRFSASYFERNPSSLNRLIPWLKRELTAVYGDYGYTVKNILAAILHHMTKFNLDSESFIRLLEPYLLQHTHHFLHEFISFVHSSNNMETYDRSATYQCPISTWMKNRDTVSAPVLCLPGDLSLVVSQQGTKPSKNSQVQGSKTEQRLHSALKQFPNGNYASKNPHISTTHQKTANKLHVWAKDERGLDDFKGVVCTTTSSLDWNNLRESRPDTEYCKNDNQEKTTKVTALLPGNAQALQHREKSPPHTCVALVEYNQVPPRKYIITETNVLNPGQQVHYHKKEVEKKKTEESSPKVFQSLPRERTSINSKSREIGNSCNCISENICSPTKNDKMLASFRRKKVEFNQSSQCEEVGSHHSTRTQRRSRSRTPRSQSWCVRSRKQPISRGQSNLFLRGSHISKHFTENVCCGPSKESEHGFEVACRVASLTSAHSAQACLTAEKRHNWVSTGEDDSQTGRRCASISSLQTEKYQSPNKQEMKEKKLVGRARRIKTLQDKKPKCHCVGTQTTAEFSDLND
ncbi:E3 ubiquitin-protein ligase Topors-like [Acomys russatus]|uniref:E3 ubiquitin-protein ligase Topors-like n=1 Tax=Acomys russatus TaxID=60746 RepID=UPI0021E3279D|nr:E3 ubiquitin-protein ligase Topors-like [Acomys russatus]